MKSEKLELVRGSGNVFRDLRHANADVEQFKAVLGAEIIKALDRERLTVRAAHGRTGIAAAAFSRIRNAALEGFATDGIAATSIRDVAKAAGVSPGLVQHHFATKTALAQAVNDYVASIALAAFAVVPVASSAQDAAEELGARVTALIRDHPAALLYLARASIEGDSGSLDLFDTFVSIAAAGCDV